jgi:hypothetical protein
LIFERLKEELRLGKSLNSALEASPRLRPISMNIKRIARVHPAWLALIGHSVRRALK